MIGRQQPSVDVNRHRLLEGVLYELRMAYIEITKMLTQAPPPGGQGNA